MLNQSTADQIADHSASGLVLDRLPNGELAWLKPKLDAADEIDQLMARQLGRRGDQEPNVDGVCYTISQAGRDLLARERAMQALFGFPWPTVAKVSA
jgi:hypothetical protein